MFVRRSVFLAAAVAAGTAFAACVGDDPPSSAPSNGPADAATDRGVIDGTPETDGSATDAGTDAPAFDVLSMTGLRLWLESTRELVAESEGSSGFGAWYDSSGRWDGGTGAPDGGRHVAMPHDVNAPTIVANGIAGRPTVSFVSGNGYLHVAHHDDFQFGLGDFVIVEVAKVTSGDGPLWLFRPGGTAGTEESFFPGVFCVAYGIGVMNGCTTPPYTPSTEPHVFAARRKSDVFTLRVDGSVRATLDRTADPPNIFVSPFSQEYAFIGNGITMQVSELLVVVGPTTDDVLDDLERHLKAKYLVP